MCLLMYALIFKFFFLCVLVFTFYLFMMVTQNILSLKVLTRKYL